MMGASDGMTECLSVISARSRWPHVAFECATTLLEPKQCATRGGWEQLLALRCMLIVVGAAVVRASGGLRGLRVVGAVAEGGVIGAAPWCCPKPDMRVLLQDQGRIIRSRLTQCCMRAV